MKIRWVVGGLIVNGVGRSDPKVIVEVDEETGLDLIDQGIAEEYMEVKSKKQTKDSENKDGGNI